MPASLWEGAGCVGRPFYLGKSKEVCDAKVYVIYRALTI